MRQLANMRYNKYITATRRQVVDTGFLHKEILHPLLYRPK